VQIGVRSYAGQLNFDIAGDADVVPDLDALREDWRMTWSD